MVTSAAAEVKSRFHPDPELSYTLPAHYYFDPEIFEREREAIWFKSWQCAGYLADLKDPGSYITAEILDQKIFIVRAKDGGLRGFYNVCMHRGHTLLEGKGQLRMITCPFHAWTYDLDGNLKAAGNSENVAGFDHGDFCLPEVRVETLAHMVFVNLDPDARPFHDMVGELEQEYRAAIPRFDELHHVRRDTYTIDANWKFVFDQVECYHCPTIHPQALIGKHIQRRTSVPHEYFSSHVNPGDHDTVVNRPESMPYVFSANDELQDTHVWWLWPNMYFQSSQGRPNVSIIRAVPLSVESSFLTMDHFTLNDPPSKVELAAMNNFRDVGFPQDIRAMELQQVGVHARGYREGRLMVDKERTWQSEHIVHLFDNLVWTSLNGPNYGTA